MPLDQDRDPFIEHFFSRIPADVAATFTAEQLDAVKRAFGARTPGAHAVDIRFSVNMWFHNLYVVLLAGTDRRKLTRRSVGRALRPLWRVANALVTVLFGVVVLLALAGVLYAAKIAFGINVFPGDMLPDMTLNRWLH